MSDSARRPGSEEFAEFYANYVSKVPAGEIRQTLSREGATTQRLLATVGEGDSLRAYAPGKWSLREVVGHLCDAERVFAYRALSFARGSRDPLPSFDQDEWMPQCNAGARSWASLLAELGVVRGATLALLESFDESAWGRTGIASANPVTVRALIWIIAGHELHHRGVVEERYLPALG